MLLQFCFGNHLFDGYFEVAVVVLGDLDRREKILDDGGEQRQVVLQEFGNVGVTHRSDQHAILVQVWVRSLQGASHDQH
jgi:hypothetical protein